MATEDYVLRQDQYNFDDEIEYRIFNNELGLQDLIDLFKDEYISVETFINAVEYLQYLEDSDIEIKPDKLSMETKKLIHQARQNKKAFEKMIQDMEYYNIRRTYDL